MAFTPLQVVYVSTGGCFLLAVLLLAWSLVRNQRSLMLRGLALLSALGVGFLGGLHVADRAVEPLETGTWACRLCWQLEERVCYAGLVASSELVGPAQPEYEEGEPVRRWFVMAGSPAHEHDWRPTGCHSKGLAMTCCYSPLEPQLARLWLALGGREPRARMEVRWLSASPPERARLEYQLRTLLYSDGPAIACARPSVEEADAQLVQSAAQQVGAWLDETPEWN